MIILLSSDDNPKTAIVKQVITGNNKREKTSHTIEEFSIERLSIYIPVVDTTTTRSVGIKLTWIKDKAEKSGSCNFNIQVLITNTVNDEMIANS